MKIEAVTVNHNTSAYLELMLRSLHARHAPDLDLAITIFDNASDDDTSRLGACAASRGIPILPSGFTTRTPYNSHGEVLRQFVLSHPDCSHYHFLDADVVFVQGDTIPCMLHELDGATDAFGIGPRFSWDGVSEIPEQVRLGNPDLYEARLHPCCALVKNTGVFQRVVRDVGLSCVNYLWANGEEYMDTFKLMTRVMMTHGLRHHISSRMILHFFSASYEWDSEDLKRDKVRRRDELLDRLRYGAFQ